MPFFSVIIPTYNRSSSLPAAIESVLHQTFADFELIVVDDGSTDRTDTVLYSYSVDDRFQYLRQENQGVCVARNLGAMKASGNYLLFLDSDDVVSGNWLEDFYSILNEGKYTIAFCDMVEYKEDGSYNIKKAKCLTGKESEIFMTGSFAIQRNLFLEAGGYDPFIKYGENTELNFRLRKFDLRVGFSGSANLIYRYTADGGSKNWHNKLHSTLYVLNKHAELFKRERRVRHFYFGVAGLAAYKSGQPILARSLFLRSFFAYPLRPKALFRLFVICVPFLAQKKWG